jgi:esterase
MVDDLDELLVSEDIAKIHLVGHSMGGKTAMLFGSMHPGKVTYLTVIDIAPDSYSDQTGRSPQVLTHMDIINVMLSVKLDQVASRTEIDKLLSYKIPDFTTRQFILKNLYRNPDNSFSWRLNLVAIKNALPLIMASLPVSISEAFPVCFVKGEHSNYLAGVHLASIKSYFPNYELITIPGAGHWVHNDKPDLLIEVLKLS